MEQGKEYDHLLKQIYDQHLEITRRLMRKGIEENEAPDLATKIMIDAGEALPGLREESKLIPWLMVITENSANRFLRERAARWKREISTMIYTETGEEISITETLVDEISVEGVIKEAEERKMLRDLLGQLDEKEHTIFVMRTLENMKFKEISEVLKMNLSTVKSTYSRTCSKLKAYADKHYGKEAYYD